MATIGTFTRSGDTFNGAVKTLSINAKTAIKPADKISDKAPDYRIFQGSVDYAGRGIMRSGVAEAERFRGVGCDRAPHNRVGCDDAAPRWVARRRGRSARPDEAVLALLAADQGGVDRGRERGSSSLTETYSAPLSLACLLQPAPSSTPLAATR